MKPTGEYYIVYKRPLLPYSSSMKPLVFKGEVLNFTPTGKCVFKNEKEQYLVTHYNDILQLEPLKMDENI